MPMHTEYDWEDLTELMKIISRQYVTPGWKQGDHSGRCTFELSVTTHDDKLAIEQGREEEWRAKLKVGCDGGQEIILGPNIPETLVCDVMHKLIAFGFREVKDR